MQGRTDRSLVKIFKDLMVTKRDLIDLRQSIQQTIRSIRDSDTIIAQLHLNHPRARPQNDPALPPGPLPHQCSLCPASFPHPDALLLHSGQSHPPCPSCLLTHAESSETHTLHCCPEATTPCSGCHLAIKKKDLDAHVQICCFRQCYKCKANIYAPAYSYHLQQCKRTHNNIPPCKQLRQHRPPRPVVLPCCLVTPLYSN